VRREIHLLKFLEIRTPEGFEPVRRGFGPRVHEHRIARVHAFLEHAGRLRGFGELAQALGTAVRLDRLVRLSERREAAKFRKLCLFEQRVG
jgi:hypothetical protein